jgi:hypothetical protein
MDIDSQPAGEAYGLTIGRTVFDPLTSNIVIGPGWDGGIAAIGTAAVAPTENLTDYVLFVDLTELPQEWWDRVQPDGRDIRVTTSNNALRPFDLISFDKDAQTGFLTTRFTLNSGIGYSIKVWAGNPTASAPGKASLFGQYNVYGTDYIGFWPEGGGQDRTRNHRDFVSVNGPMFGDAVGPEAYLPGTRYTNSTANFALPYTFSTATTDEDPGSGFIRFDNATQESATQWFVDLLDQDGVDRTSLFTAANGFLTIAKPGDVTDNITVQFSSIETPSGYRRINVTLTDSSGASPFANNDDVILYIQDPDFYPPMEPEEPPPFLIPTALYTFPSAFSVTNYTIIVNESIQHKANYGEVGSGPGVSLSNVEDSFKTFYMLSQMDLNDSIAFGGIAQDESVSVATVGTYPDDIGVFFNNAVTVSSTTGYEFYQDGISVDTDATAAVPSLIDEIGVRSSFDTRVEPVESIMSSLQIYNAAKSAVFVAYNHSMIDQSTFWSSWTV